MRLSVAFGLCLTLGGAVWARPAPFRYDLEYPFIKYTTAATSDRVSALRVRLGRGEARLSAAGPRGYLDSLLRALEIDVTSQMLVYSKTSLQTGRIRAATPRAIYFNDDTYVAWVQGAASIEIASMDPVLGPVFYTLDQGRAAPRFDRQVEKCLACHDSYSLTGGGVPRFITGSGYTKPSGDLASHEAWILTTHKTPLRSRWGGWFVTGRPGGEAHLGNMLVPDAAALRDLDRARVGTLQTLDGVVDTRPYPAATSDIVALLVLEHQVTVQNAIVQANYAARGALDKGEATEARLREIAEPLVEALVFAGEAPLPNAIAGSSGFAERFAARGTRDSQGRSPRDFDLSRRIFKSQVSYLVDSPAFAALPDALRRVVQRRIDAARRDGVR